MVMDALLMVLGEKTDEKLKWLDQPKGKGSANNYLLAGILLNPASIKPLLIRLVRLRAIELQANSQDRHYLFR